MMIITVACGAGRPAPLALYEHIQNEQLIMILKLI